MYIKYMYWNRHCSKRMHIKAFFAPRLHAKIEFPELGSVGSVHHIAAVTVLGRWPAPHT